MRKISVLRDVLILLFLVVNITISLGTVSLYINLKNSIVFDVDRVRQDYARDLEAALLQGCFEGTEYPEEYKQDVPGFNVNSPPNWCGKFVKTRDEWIGDKVWKLGRDPWR